MANSCDLECVIVLVSILFVLCFGIPTFFYFFYTLLNLPNYYQPKFFIGTVCYLFDNKSVGIFGKL